MLALDRPVLVGHVKIVAGRRHRVMIAQRFVAARLVGASVIVEIAERGRQAVRTVLGRRRRRATTMRSAGRPRER